MKAIKLLLITLLFLGVIAGVFYLSTRGSRSVGRLNNYSDEYNKLLTQITDEWKDIRVWDADKYEKLWIKIKQSGVSERGRRSKGKLIEHNSNEASRTIYDDITAEWRKRDCSRDTIKKYMDAVAFVKEKDENFEKRDSIKKIEEVNSTYSWALGLIGRSLELEPKFPNNSEYPNRVPSWNDFKAHESKYITQRNSIRNSRNYKIYLSNITELRRGLDGIEGKLDVAKDNFYKKLAKEIKEYYKPRERTEKERNNLNRVIENFQKEYSKTPSEVEALLRFQREFNSDVEKELERKRKEADAAHQREADSLRRVQKEQERATQAAQEEQNEGENVGGNNKNRGRRGHNKNK